MCVYMCIIHTQHIRKTRAHKHTQYSHRYSATDIHTDIHRGTQDRDFKGANNRVFIIPTEMLSKDYNAAGC